ncbi:MAG TPA: DinB family protein [Thermoanaerobaculia bacterium]|nr:DinB family protein [Thermoanaerobaculia bacterium]
MISTRAEILDALRDAERTTVAYWNAFPLEEFFAQIGEAWSPAENVRHLTKSIPPVAKALTTPRLILRVMFGNPRRASVSLDDLVARYRKLLDEGGKAGRFSPSAHTESDLAAWRAKIMSDHHIAQEQLRASIERWPDAKLDRYQLPHPLLGKLTIREMLLFTLYHEGHHVEVVKRRKAGTAA